jgi:hypothetical protein
MVEPIQVYLQGLFGDVKLTFSYIALVLFVTISNAGINLIRSDTKDLYKIIKEHAIVQHFKFRPFDLLYVA